MPRFVCYSNTKQLDIIDELTLAKFTHYLPRVCTVTELQSLLTDKSEYWMANSDLASFDSVFK